jgi:hypothetical protein
LDPINYISICSLANAIFEERVYSKQFIFRLGGIARDFISLAKRGGRTMTRENKTWHVKEELQDFDGVSLYPSARARMEIPLGIPNVLKELSYEWVSNKKNAQAYVVEIRISAVRKRRQFPLMATMNKNLLDWTNDMEGQVVVLDDYALEDWIKWHQIEFSILRGLYWDHGTSKACQSVIKEIFQERKQLKRDGNALEKIYKLILNSIFGKTIQKPITENLTYRNRAKAENWLKMNYSRHIETQRNEEQDLCEIRYKEPISRQLNLCIFGVKVLSMSKRIMSEVMCLGEDIGCQMYYQDTDSIHIRTVDIPLLETEFKKLYGRELIAKDKDENLGEFHNDFSPMLNKVPPGVKVVGSVESIFVGKKFYIDKLLLSNGGYDVMFKGKGLTKESILGAARRKSPERDDIDALMTLYKALLDGEKVRFNLAEGKPSFEHKSFWQISSRKEFWRTINGQNVLEEEQEEEAEDLVTNLETE